MGCDSLTNVLKLLFVAQDIRLKAGCLSWLFLNLLAQVSIAVLSITYSTTPGVADIYRASNISTISIPDMTQFAPNTGRFVNDYLVESLGAHILGDVSSSYNISKLPDEPLGGKPWASNPAGFWNATDHWEYVFLDTALGGRSSQGVLSIYTNRVVKSRGVCTTPPYEITVNDTLATVRLLEDDRAVTIPSIVLGGESVSYITKPILLNQGAKWTCGDGCSNVKVIEPQAGPPVPGSSFIAGPGSPYFFYDCNITVTANSQDLSLSQAAVAAQAIALSGQIHEQWRIADEDNRNNQYVSYNFGLPFGTPQNNSVSGMASLVSRFAIGVVAAAAQNNPPRLVQGHSPMQGPWESFA
ncbi:MAG: hypothetical protein M1817_004597 [Caeruleum heppii]|nr:MAG: hypothetical protein M1817_004597 [Caeruleum heppii]